MSSATGVPSTEDPAETTTLRLTIQGITAYVDRLGNFTRSDIVHCAGIRWHLYVKPATVDGKRCLSCFVVGHSEGPWSAWVEGKYHIMRKVGDGVDFILKGHNTLFGNGALANSFGQADLISREDLLAPANGLIDSDTIELRVEITVSNVQGAAFDVFGEAGILAADVKITVEGTLFYANKGYLSVTTQFFRTMFSEKWQGSGMQEVTLHDIKASDFKTFLLAVYPSRVQISDANVVIIYRLCNYFGVKTLFASCEAFLLGTSGITALDKLVVSQEMQRNHLKERVISKLTLTDMKLIAGDPRSKELDKDTLLRIMKEVGTS